MRCCNEKNKSCQKPENLKGKPEDCSPEQIKKCHSDSGKHPCVTRVNKSKAAGR